jgi:hypothetical protein
MTPDADWTINCNCVKYGAIVSAARCNRVSKDQTSDHIQHDVLRWGFELPRRLPRRLLCSGMACLIVWCHTYFSEECTASIFTAEEYAMPSSEVAKCVAMWDYCNPDGQSSMLLLIVGVLMRVYTAWHPRRQFTYSSIPIVTVVPCISGEFGSFLFSERESIGLYWGTGLDDPLIGHPEVNLCMFRRHSFAFRPECSMCCLCRHQNRRHFTISKSGPTVYHFCHSMLYKSQVVIFTYYVKH